MSPRVQRDGQFSASKVHIEKLRTSPANEWPEPGQPRARQTPSALSLPTRALGQAPGPARGTTRASPAGPAPQVGFTSFEGRLEGGGTQDQPSHRGKVKGVRSRTFGASAAQLSARIPEAPGPLKGAQSEHVAVAERGQSFRSVPIHPLPPPPKGGHRHCQLSLPGVISEALTHNLNLFCKGHVCRHGLQLAYEPGN